MQAILIRLERNNTVLTSSLSGFLFCTAYSQSGKTIWFDAIVDNAIAATITIDVAEENPPKNANAANVPRSSAKGIVSTNKSGFETSGKMFNPVAAIGKTKIHIKSK